MFPVCVICLVQPTEASDLNNYLPNSIVHGKRFKQREYLQQMMQVWLYIVPIKYSAHSV